MGDVGVPVLGVQLEGAADVAGAVGTAQSGRVGGGDVGRVRAGLCLGGVDFLGGGGGGWLLCGVSRMSFSLC